MMMGGATFLFGVLRGQNPFDAALTGIIVGATNYAVIKSYQASVEQRQYVYRRGDYAVSRPVVRRNLQSSRSRVVAVRVPKAKASSGGGSTVMLVSADNGTPVSDKAYDLEKRPGDGEAITVNGQRAIYSGDAPL